MTQPLPPELFIRIGELLPADGVCNLSMTCRQYRSLLIHTVFRYIVVDNDSIFQLEEFLQIEGVRNAVIHITLRHITPPNDHDEGQHSPDYRQLGLVFPDTRSLKIEIIDDFTPSFKDLPKVIEQFLDMKMPALETLYLSLVNREVPIVSLPEVPALPPLKNLSITWEAECEPVHFEEIYSDLISQLIPHPSSTLIAFTLKAKAGPFIEDFDGLQSILALMPNIKRISFTGPVLRIEVPEDIAPAVWAFAGCSQLQAICLGCEIIEYGPPWLSQSVSIIRSLSEACPALQAFVWQDRTFWYAATDESSSCSMRIRRKDGKCDVFVLWETWMSEVLCEALEQVLVPRDEVDATYFI